MQEIDSKTVEFWAQVANSRTRTRWCRRARYKQLAWTFAIWFARSLKRCVDVFGSGVLLLVLQPVFLGIILGIKLEDRGSIFFGQKRVGKMGKPFTMLKFRSMVPNADAMKDALLEENRHGDGVTFKIEKDPRITRIGRWLRRLSLDELPQLWNVFRGDMSLVGPRPPVPREVALYKSFHLRRLAVTPGITCFWQVGGRSNIDFEGQVRLDLEYMRTRGFWQDFKILLKTIPAVIFGKGAY